MRRTAWASIAVLAISGCSVFFPEDDDPAPIVKQPETIELPVRHIPASARCVEAYIDCDNNCDSDQANKDCSDVSPLCFPSNPRVQACEDKCRWQRGCYPWEIGVQPGYPCRPDPSKPNTDCNAQLCLKASIACFFDCEKLLSGPSGEIDDCIQSCYDLYGCAPSSGPDPCDPLPAGYIYCACPDKHGVRCHSDDGRSCQ